MNQSVQVFGNQVQLTLENLKCGGCGKTIQKALSALDLVNIVVNPEFDHVSFDSPIEPSQVNAAIAALEALGYPLAHSAGGFKTLKLTAKRYVSYALGKLS